MANMGRIASWRAEMHGAWAPWELTVGEVGGLGERVLIEVTLAGRSSVSQIAMSAPF